MGSIDLIPLHTHIRGMISARYDSVVKLIHSVYDKRRRKDGVSAKGRKEPRERDGHEWQKTVLLSLKEASTNMLTKFRTTAFQTTATDSGHDVRGVANDFLARGFTEEKPLTQMQLQKLCYIAHGFTLAILDHALTSNKIEAWGFGPVYPDLYDALKKTGDRFVPELICQNNWANDPSVKGDVVNANLDNNERRLLDTVWKDYGSFEAFQLSALTHEEGSPWAKVFKPGIKHIRIPDSLIKEYFLELTKQNH